MNVEQAREVSHTANESLFAMIEQLDDTQLYAELWKYLIRYSKLADLCVWILFMWY